MIFEMFGLVLVGLSGCTDGGTTEDDSGHHHHSTHPETCGEPGEEYSPGMTAQGEEGVVEVSLVEATPAPPDKGDNLFTVQVAQVADDALLDDATVLLRPWMPEHGHGSSPETFALSWTGSDGLYETDSVNLFMGGLWELSFEVTTEEGSTDTATFTFCVEG